MAPTDEQLRATALAHDPEHQRQQITARLPPGCTFNDLGMYREMHVLVVTCPHVQSITYRWREGKVDRQALTVVLDP